MFVQLCFGNCHGRMRTTDASLATCRRMRIASCNSCSLPPSSPLPSLQHVRIPNLSANQLSTATGPPPAFSKSVAIKIQSPLLNLFYTNKISLPKQKQDYLIPPLLRLPSPINQRGRGSGSLIQICYNQFHFDMSEERSPIKGAGNDPAENEVPQGVPEPIETKEEMKGGKEEREDRLKNSIVSVQKTMAKDELWKPYDFLFPGGKLAKLIKVNNIYKKNLPVREMLDKFKYTEMTPVVNIIGAMEKGRGKFYAGIARAAFNTDAVIVDNGLASGLEKFTLRRGVKLLGIAPEGEIKFPKINPSQVDGTELANGHTHLFLVNNPDKDLKWGGEVQFKIDLCIKIAEGKKRAEGVGRCKIVSILVADSTFDIVDEVRACVEAEIPIIVVPGSPVCDELIKLSSGDDDGSSGSGELRELIEKGHFFYCNSTNSEDIAQLTHLLLSIRPW